MTFLYRISQRDIIYTNLIVFDNTFVTLLNNWWYISVFEFHIYFDSSLLFLYLRFLKFLMWLPKRYLKSFCNSKIKLFSPLVGFLVRCLVHYFWGSDTYFVAVIFLFISSYNHMLYLKLYSKYSFCVTKWCWNDALTSIINFYWEGSYPPLWDVSLPWILTTKIKYVYFSYI